MKLAKQILSTSTLNDATTVNKTLPCSDCQTRLLDSTYGTLMLPKCYKPVPINAWYLWCFSSTSQQLEHINPFLSSPKEHIKPQCATISNVSFPQTPALLYLSAKIPISDKSRNTRNDGPFLSQAFRRASVNTNLFMMYSEHAKISFLLVFHRCFF